MDDRLLTVEDWLRRHGADSPILVVAPHGGRRTRPVRRSDGVNDLHTAEIAEEIAERLGARALINHSLDRNEADLNRISDLCEKAPEFLAALREHVETVPGGRALALFVHGWNMTLPCCDIGVGLKRHKNKLFGRYPTVSREFFDAALPALERAFTERGLTAELGMRYPGIGADNVMQLFSGRHHDHRHEDVRVLAGLAVAGRVEAVQLELGIPLRWRGPRRRETIDAIVEAITGIDLQMRGPRALWKLPAANKTVAGNAVVEAGYGLQAALAQPGIGLFAGVEATGKTSMAVRICLVREDGTMLLFVAESSWDGSAGCYQTNGLSWRVGDDGAWRARFAGPMVAYPTHDAYEDLETGLADSTLAEAAVELDAYEDNELPPPFRRLRYKLVWRGAQGVPDGDLSGSCVAVCERGGRRGSAVQRPPTGAGSDSARIFFTVGRAPEAVGDALIDSDGCVHSGRGAGTRVTARVPVWRPMPGGVLTRFTFGTLRSADGERMAVYDRLEVFTAAPKRPT